MTTSESWHMYQKIQETPKQFRKSAGIAPGREVNHVVNMGQFRKLTYNKAAWSLKIHFCADSSQTVH